MSACESDDGKGQRAFEAFASAGRWIGAHAVSAAHYSGGRIRQRQDEHGREIGHAIFSRQCEQNRHCDREKKLADGFAAHAVDHAGDVIIQGRQVASGDQQYHVSSAQHRYGPKAIKEPRQRAKDEPHRHVQQFSREFRAAAGALVEPADGPERRSRGGKKGEDDG